MARSEGRSAGGGFLSRLIILVILIPVAIAIIAYVLSPNGPFKATKADPPQPVLIEQIHKQYKIITANVQASKIETGYTESALPFSEDKYQYNAVFTLTAGIDMSKVKDSDITVSGTTVTIRLPEPEILTTELDLSRSQIINHDEQFLSGFSKDPNLLTAVQAQARKDITTQVLQQGQLMQDAKTYAEENLGNLARQMGFTEVKFVYGPAPSPTPDSTPKATPAPA